MVRFLKFCMVDSSSNWSVFLNISNFPLSAALFFDVIPGFCFLHLSVKVIETNPWRQLYKSDTGGFNSIISKQTRLVLEKY